MGKRRRRVIKVHGQSQRGVGLRWEVGVGRAGKNGEGKMESTVLEQQ